jgi:hypothetical protein
MGISVFQSVGSAGRSNPNIDTGVMVGADREEVQATGRKQGIADPDNLPYLLLTK